MEGIQDQILGRVQEEYLQTSVCVFFVFFFFKEMIVRTRGIEIKNVPEFELNLSPFLVCLSSSGLLSCSHSPL